MVQPNSYTDCGLLSTGQTAEPGSNALPEPICFVVDINSSASTHRGKALVGERVDHSAPGYSPRFGGAFRPYFSIL